ncbi:hypothetical protein [Clostridium sp. C8-1-8]|uniref:hypothetical protein n=1 Tax=Clostridium sp. C8-1-8 TaxID=2698831 RepID=UPI001367BB3C|nr:hypothetical protein [Clostridium sp. C8-1-8]
MKKLLKKTMAVGLSLALFGAVSASAVSLYDQNVSTGTVKLGLLNKSGSSSAIAETDFVQKNGYQSLRSYVYLSAKNSSGVVLNNTQGYGRGNGTDARPDVSTCSLTQAGTYRWMSTHRSEGISDYAYLTLTN